MKVLQRKTGSGRLPKRDDSDIPSIIDELNEEQKNEIIEAWIKEQKNKKDKNSVKKIKSLNNTLKSKISTIHRTTFYINKKERKYKFDYLKNKVIDIFNKSKGIYGSRKIAIVLSQNGLHINDRTLRNYMTRWGLITLTSKKKRKIEIKNTKVEYKDLVNRNYNPELDNIVATDVSYIPAIATHNHVYLSVAISHKTKKIESWKISENNDVKLVLDALNKLNRRKFILHSDQGFNIILTKLLKK